MSKTFPYLVPTMTARPLSLRAAANTSAALAVPSLTSNPIGTVAGNAVAATSGLRGSPIQSET